MLYVLMYISTIYGLETTDQQNRFCALPKLPKPFRESCAFVVEKNQEVYNRILYCSACLSYRFVYIFEVFLSVVYTFCTSFSNMVVVAKLCVLVDAVISHCLSFFVSVQLCLVSGSLIAYRCLYI